MDGPDGNNLFALAIRRLLNSLLLAQRDKHLECERYERIPTRNTQTPFTPIIPEFERGSRIDRALNLAIAEMYLQGVSTRKVAKVMNALPSLIAHPWYSDDSERPTSWKALTDNSNAE